jgi:hypothetical protein
MELLLRAIVAILYRHLFGLLRLHIADTTLHRPVLMLQLDFGVPIVQPRSEFSLDILVLV